MVDSGRCKLTYEDNEEEFADFYEYEEEGETSSTSQVRSECLMGQHLLEG